MYVGIDIVRTCVCVCEKYFFISLSLLRMSHQLLGRENKTNHMNELNLREATHLLVVFIFLMYHTSEEDQHFVCITEAQFEARHILLYSLIIGLFQI